jgi:dihydrodipicolinate synthase/N-acetylneuraminate lyase
MDLLSNAGLSGIWLPLITPFIDGAVDERSLARLVAHYMQQKIDGLIVAATTGEGLVLDDAETEQVVALAADVLAQRIPLFLGLCGSDTRRLVRRLAATDAWPVDGYLITCPYYSRPSQQGLLQHFAALADATDRPILIYNIPYRTGVNLGNDTLLRLAERANVVGVKDCCADAAQSADLLRRRGPDFTVLTGRMRCSMTRSRMAPMAASWQARMSMCRRSLRYETRCWTGERPTRWCNGDHCWMWSAYCSPNRTRHRSSTCCGGVA